MRHIPEEELHAYLDQALSRSQCIEIEIHLARCAACRESRDDIAGLRDRTTALLGRVVPPRSPAPPLPLLVAKAEERRRHSWRRPALWAASLAGALLAGWAVRGSLEDVRSSRIAIAEVPTIAEMPPIIAQAPPAPTAEESSREDTASAPEPRRVPEFPSIPASRPVPEVRYTEARSGDLAVPPAIPLVAVALDGSWHSVSLSDAEEATGGLVPLVPDLPVLGIQLRPAGTQERPLIFVTQRSVSGAPIHIVEGPVADVAELVAGRLAEGGLLSSDPARSPPDYVETGAAFDRTSRVLAVVGALTVDTLNTLARAVVLR